jgi:tripartite-type tricarboxylate transporter receptor subunit TctC
MNRRLFGQVCSLVAMAFATLSAAIPSFAQTASDYPTKPIRLMVGYAPGGLPDTVARIMGRRLSERLGQPVVVENRPGANGMVAIQAMLASPPDGHTLLIADGSWSSVLPSLYKKLPFNPAKDIVPVSLMANSPLFLAANANVPANSLKEYIALAKSKPGRMNYGSSGIGSTHHLTMEAMKERLGLFIVHIPFRGTGQSVPALVGNQVEVLFSALPSLAGFVKSGQVKLLATNGAKRSPQAPDVPAIAEVIPGFDFAVVIGMLAHSATPPAIIQRLSNEVAQVAKMPDVVQSLATAGIESVGGSAAEYAKVINAENARYKTAIERAGLKPE